MRKWKIALNCTFRSSISCPRCINYETRISLYKVRAFTQLTLSRPQGCIRIQNFVFSPWEHCYGVTAYHTFREAPTQELDAWGLTWDIFKSIDNGGAMNKYIECYCRTKFNVLCKLCEWKASQGQGCCLMNAFYLCNGARCSYLHFYMRSRHSLNHDNGVHYTTSSVGTCSPCFSFSSCN